MVFPSKRCLTCKNRHVKCDTSRPRCNRCRKACRDCTWEDKTEPTAGISFKSENAFASGQPRRPRKRSSPMNQLHRNISRTQRSVLMNSMNLNFPMEIYAFNYWRENLASWPSDLIDIGQEYGAAGASYYSSSEEESAASSIYLAVSAFSLVVFGRATMAAEVLQRSEKLYNRSIVQLRKELSRLSNDTIDHILIVTIILSKYNNMMYGFREGGNEKLLSSAEHKYGAPLGNYASHYKGTMSLLQIRQQRGYTQNVSLDRALRRTIIRAYLSSSQPLPGWLQDDNIYSEEDPALRLDYIMIKAASLRSKSVAFLNDVQSGNISEIKKLETVLVEAQLLDQQFALWAQYSPQHWTFTIQNSPNHNDKSYENVNDCLFYDECFYSYTTHFQAVMWNRYSAVRALVNSIQIQILTLMIGNTFEAWDSTYSKQLKWCQDNIRCLATDLCRGIPFFYLYDTNFPARGDVFPYKEPTELIASSSQFSPIMLAVLLVWPISLVVDIEEVPLDQKQWLKCRLNVFTKAIGALKGQS